MRLWVRRFSTYIAILLIALPIWGCAKVTPVETTEENLPQSVIVVPPSTEETTVDTTEEDTENKFYNPLTGLYGTDDLSLRRPIVVMFDNFYSARPQAGLAKADVVYEILAEGLITRYMGVFYSQYPDHIGPVRSSRPYFVEKALEFDPYYIHVGGSMKALSDIKKYQMADIDGLSSGAYWRESHKKAPHNMYTSSDALLKEGTRLRYEVSSTFEFQPFGDDFEALTGNEASEITFVYKEPTQSDKIGYFTSYKYNDDSNLYYRYTNGEMHLDEDTQEHLSCTNILVQYAKTTVIDNEGRLSIDLISTGKGKYYSGGKYIDVTWQKTSANAPTIFYDQSNKPIKLNPGKTWIQVVKTGNEEIIKQ